MTTGQQDQNHRRRYLVIGSAVFGLLVLMVLAFTCSMVQMGQVSQAAPEVCETLDTFMKSAGSGDFQAALGCLAPDIRPESLGREFRDDASGEANPCLEQYTSLTRVSLVVMNFFEWGSWPRRIMKIQASATLKDGGENLLAAEMVKSHGHWAISFIYLDGCDFRLGTNRIFK